jgi:hypothetical protein
MAIELKTQQALRPIQRLPFCYLCGQAFLPGDDRNVDHVPPTTIFLAADRDFPLILPTHTICNAGRSVEDQTIGQLLGILHNRAPSSQQNKLKFEFGELPDGQTVVAVGGLDLRGIIRRWVRGFHAALYREFLPDAYLFMTNPPLAEGERSADGLQFGRVEPLIHEAARELRENRSRGLIDQIHCRNLKMRYECVWMKADAGEWLCFYALDLYDWTKLGDVKTFGSRGCVGVYHRADYSLPSGATCGIRSAIKMPPGEGSLDPFEIGSHCDHKPGP